MKRTALLLLLAISTLPLFAQKYNMTKGNIFFHSDAKLEKIEAYNRKFTSVIDMSTGGVAFLLTIKDFTFDNSLMYEHFNEKYMNSDKFPTSTFNGTINEFKTIDLTKDGKYNVTVTGKLTMHGVTKEMTVPGTIEVKGGQLIVDANFTVALIDYNIERPSLVVDNIAENVDIHVSGLYTVAQ